METPKRARPACGYMGCTHGAYHAGLCSVAPPPLRRQAPLPRRIASSSMSKDPAATTIPFPTALSTETLSELFEHSVGDLLFTVDEVQQLIDML